MTDFTRFSSYFERRHMDERMGKKNSQNKKSQKNGNEKLSEKRRLAFTGSCWDSCLTPNVSK